jgi:hypothetical protein
MIADETKQVETLGRDADQAQGENSALSNVASPCPMRSNGR